MRHIVMSALLAALWNPAVEAQRLSGRLLTSFYTWERFDTVGESSNYLRAYQGMQLEYVDRDFSLHTYVQGTTNFGNTFSTDPSVRFYNLYARWKNIGTVGEILVGRVPVYAGVGNGTIDGVLGKLRLWKGKLRMTSYVGGNVPDRQKAKFQSNIDDNFTWGGQLVAGLFDDFNLGVSYLNRRSESAAYAALRPDSLFNPVVVQVANTPRVDEYLSGDVQYRWRGSVTAYARYDHDLKLERTYRAQASLRVGVTDHLSVTGDYIYRAPRIPFNSFFSVFSYGTVREWEGGIEYAFTPALRAFTRLATVRYSDTNTTRWTIGTGTQYLSANYSFSNGYAGELSSLSAQMAYPFRDRTIIPSVALSFSRYKLSESQVSADEAWSGVVGLTVRPARSFSFDLQSQWLRNKIVKNDVRLLGRFTFWFSERVNIF